MFRPLLLLLPLLLAAVGCDLRFPGPGADGPGADFSVEGYPFDFTLPSVDGGTVSKADFAGQVLVVDIWGTWCPPCRREVPHFVELQEELGDQGLQIVGINYEDADTLEGTIAKINEFTSDVPVNYPLLIGDEETRAQVPNFTGFPTTLFIDRTGRVRMTVVGAKPKAELRSYIEPLLAETAG
jgi:thiol-disulfide isomerase/thioredoxin